MNNLVYLAIYALITLFAVIFACFVLGMVELFRQTIKERYVYLHFEHVRTHKKVQDLRRYHVGGLIKDHRRFL